MADINKETASATDTDAPKKKAMGAKTAGSLGGALMLLIIGIIEAVTNSGILDFIK